MHDPQPPTGSPADALQFDTADPVAPQPAGLTCALCTTQIRTVYHSVNGQTACSDCRVQLESPASGSVGKALLFGGGAGLAGWVIYFGTVKLFNLELSLIAILVGYMVGRAVNVASAGRGGVGYQALAMLITYVACTTAYLPFLAEGIAAGGVTGAAGWIAAAALSLMRPFLAFDLIGTVILAVGVWQAWSMNRRVELSITGPHAVAAPQDAEPALA